MSGTVIDIIWAVTFSLLGGLTGAVMFVALAARLPKIFDALTPNVDEGKEMIRGNRAVAEYFGRIVSAGIVGISIIIGAAVLGGLLAGLR